MQKITIIYHKIETNYHSRKGVLMSDNDGNLFPGKYKPLVGIMTEALSLTAIIPFPMQNSASRAVMTASQFAQSLVLIQTDERRIQTGIEVELGKYSFKIEMPVDARILQVIDKYHGNIGDTVFKENSETTIIYEDVATQKIGCIVIPKFCRNHQHFGFLYKPTKNMELIRKGAMIPKGTVFAESPSMKENGGWSPGRNLNVVFNTSRQGGDDAIKISRSCAKKFAYQLIETRRVSCGNSQFPRNLYGTPDNFKPFPGIGEKIRKDGLLACLVDYDSDFAPVTMSKYALTVPDMVYDDRVYSRPGDGVVVDIRLIRNNDGRSTMPTGMMDHFDKYGIAYKRYLEKLIDAEKEYRSIHYKRSGKDTLQLEDEFHRRVVEALAITNGYGLSRSQDKQEPRVNLIYRQAVLDDYTIEFDILYTMIPDISNKITDFHGAKGIVCTIVDDDMMPMDSAGNRAEIEMEMGSRISRMNLGGVTEMTLGGVARDICHQMRRMLGLDRDRRYSMRELRPKADKMIEVFDYLLLPLYSHVNKIQYETYRDLRNDSSSREELLEHIRMSINEEPMLFCNAENSTAPVDIIENISRDIISDLNKDGRFEIVRGPLLYPNGDGTYEVGLNVGQIGKMHFILLDKIGEDGSAVSSGRLHHTGVLGQLTKTSKHTTPWRDTPVRQFGETEIRLILAMKDRRLAAEIMDRNNNPEIHAMIVRQYIESITPTNIPLLIDRNIHPYGNNRPIQIMKSFVTCLGLELAHSDDN